MSKTMLLGIKPFEVTDMAQKINIKPFLDADGKITQLPQRRLVRIAVLAYLAEKFEIDRDYKEKEVNAICDAWHTFGDFFILRRELIDFGLLKRERDGSRYWKEDNKVEVGSDSPLAPPLGRRLSPWFRRFSAERRRVKVKKRRMNRRF